jgi:hypothetical protein
LHAAVAVMDESGEVVRENTSMMNATYTHPEWVFT